MACVKGRTDPDLWEKSKKKAIAQLGGRFSARAMQLAGKMYRDAGGGYCGEKTTAQKSMSKWSDEKWTTADGKPAKRTVDGKVVYDRYLPKEAWGKLSKAQKLATRRKKRASDKQFVANTAKAAKAGKSARGENMSVQDRMVRLLSEAKGDTYSSALLDTDAAFLEKVAAILKKRHGNKFEELRVHRGISTVFLAFKGQDKGDIDIDGYVALSTQTWTDVNVVLDAKHAMRGRIDRTVPFKTGMLTPEAVADIVSEQMGK